MSMDGGNSYFLVEDYWGYGDARQFAPDGGGELYYIVGIDDSGREITKHSNIVRPDDAPDIALLNGLVAHFGLDETTGDYVDEVGGQVLQLVNGSALRVAGLQGLAVELDGSGGSLLSSADTTAFSPTADGFTISFWANLSDLVDASATTYLLSVWQDYGWPSGSSWHICSYDPSGGNHALEIIDPAFRVLPFAADLTAGWVHLCVTFEPLSSTWTIFANGAAVAADTFGFVSAVGRLGLGADTAPMACVTQGIYDELAFWSRALNADEVGALYNAGSGLAYDNY